MPAGQWAFLHEAVIYEYLMHRFDENQLQMQQIFRDGKIEMKERWVTVQELEPIRNTFFPDIKHLIIKSDLKGARPAEVKFITSLFNYHRSKDDVEKYEEFSKQNGCIIVLKHDYVPVGLLDTYNIDIFQLNEIDFITQFRKNMGNGSVEKFLRNRRGYSACKHFWAVVPYR
jgi:hypothetical protein